MSTFILLCSVCINWIYPPIRRDINQMAKDKRVNLCAHSVQWSPIGSAWQDPLTQHVWAQLKTIFSGSDGHAIVAFLWPWHRIQMLRKICRVLSVSKTQSASASPPPSHASAAFVPFHSLKPAVSLRPVLRMVDHTSSITTWRYVSGFYTDTKLYQWQRHRSVNNSPKIITHQYATRSRTMTFQLQILPLHYYAIPICNYTDKDWLSTSFITTFRVVNFPEI